MMAVVDNSMPNARQPLRSRLPQQLARLRPGLRGFWSWWMHALASWLPPRLRLLFGLARERLLLRHDGAHLDLTLARGDAHSALGQVPWPLPEEAGDDPFATLLSKHIVDLPRWLLLPAGAGLRRRLLLPAAAQARLRDVVGFEIERQTPFPPAEVHYDARLVARRGDQIEVELVVVPRALLEAAVAALGPLAPSLAGIDMAGADGNALGINLQVDGQRHRRSDPWRNWNLALAALAALALGAGMWQVLANRERGADAFEREVTARARQARGVALERQRLIDLAEGMRFLHDTRAARPTSVEVLDDLSRRLQDSTYLEKVSIEDTRLTLIGQSSEASTLVGRLESSKLWRAPALTGALQPDPRTHLDRFTLSAELAIAGAAPREAGDARSRR